MVKDIAKGQIKGQIISGKFGEILARQKSDQEFELGEILVSENDDSKIFLQVYDLQYGSQVSQQNLELISGMSLEEDTDFEFMDKNLRNYKIAFLKNMISVDKSGDEKNGKVGISKSLPSMFSMVRTVTREDLSFITKPDDPFFLGNLRSGSKALDVPIYLDGSKVLTHHVLICGTTGKGKSVLMSNILWDCTGKDYNGMLVLDPHNEYYLGNGKIGLKDHPSKNVLYYSVRSNIPGSKGLKINIKILRPAHFGCLDFSDAQEQAMNAYYRDYGIKWIESLLLERPIKVNFNDATINVLKRRLMYLLDIDIGNSAGGNEVFCNGIFEFNAGEATISGICDSLEDAKTVIIDTSSFGGQVELLVGSLIVTEMFNRYRQHKMQDTLDDRPVISIVLEEAPRVLGKEVLEKGSNIFSTIAREGRKFKVGLVAITQLPSMIPRDILANINTKIILGTEMVQERQAIIDSASQDLSTDSRNIASLDKGECIVSSNFAKFAIPIKIPLFDDFAKKDVQLKLKETKENKSEDKEILGLGE